MNDTIPSEFEAAAVASELERLSVRLGIKGAFSSYQLKRNDPGWDSLGFERKLVSILQDEELRRNVNAVKRLRADSNLPAEFIGARFSNIITGGGRKMDDNVLTIIRAGEWMTREEPADLVISGPTGVGKSFIAACCANYLIDHRKSVYFIRSSRLLLDLTLHRLANTVEKRKSELCRLGLLILDDFLLENMSEEQCSDLLDVIKDRHGKSTIFTTQFTIDGWLERLGDTPLTEAIVDRLSNSAYKLHITGPSLRQPVSQ